MSSSSSNTSVHILVFPYPAQGHILPLLDLTHHLSLRGLEITILITPKNLSILSPLLSAAPSIQTLILPFPPDPSMPAGVENLKDIGYLGNIPVITALSKLRDPIIQWFTSHHNPPVAILSDFFLGWTQPLAQNLGIPRICFYPSGAFSVATLHYLWTICDVVKPGTEVTFEGLPRTPCFSWDKVSSLFRRWMETKSEKVVADFIRSSWAENGLSWASVFNSFWALDDEFLEYYSNILGQTRVYTVGPLSMVNGSIESRVSDEMSQLCDSNGDVISWLDQWDDGSVLYVCFGSQKLLKKAQVEALAIALERSGVRFVWVVKPLSVQHLEDGYGSVPNGFDERVAGRGFKLEGWAPQTAILGHRAVGGFLSHCGWNSTLEAIAASVTILCWPMEADQFANAKLLVEYKRAAVLVCEGSLTVPDSAELARKIDESMHGDARGRAEVKELKKAALAAVEEGGSTNTDLDGLVQKLAQLKAQK